MNLAPVLLAFALAAQARAPASAPPSDEVRARVRALLLPIDRPVSPEAVRAVGPGADEALAEIALSRDFPARRARALEVLAALRSARADEVHRAAAAASEPRSVRRASGVFATAVEPFGTSMETWKGVLNPGSSKHGKARLASFASNCVNA